VNGLIPYEYSGKKVSPWGGMRLIKEFHDRIGFYEKLRELPFYEPGSALGVEHYEIIESFIMSVILGAGNCFSASQISYDEVLKEIFQWKKGMPSQSTLSRFFRKYDHDLSDEIFSNLFNWWFNSASATEFEEFLDNTFTMVPRDQIGLLRGDSGFSGNNVLNDLESRQLDYIIAMPMKAGLVDAILTPRKWVASETQGVDLCSFTYQSKGWGKSRRIVVVRKDVEKLPNCGGKTLFTHEDDYLRYRYSAYVTTSDLSNELIWVAYKHRAEAENQIKELKYDYAMEGFCFKDIHATEFAFRWVMMAYNLMSYVRNKIAVSKVKHTLSTLKFRCIAIGAYLVSSGRQKKLMLAVSGSKRDYIEGLFEKIRRFGDPLEISTA